jgi:ABC-type proline/glycine betaine transport system permease subunit
MIIYLESFFLPPYGILIGIRYLRQKENKSIVVGVVAIILTFLSLVMFVIMTRGLIDTVNTQVNNQLQFSGY